MKLAEAFVSVGLDTAGLTGGLRTLGSNLKGQMSSLGRAAGAAFSSALTAGITAGVATLVSGGLFAGLATMAASDAAEIKSKFEAVFKDLTGEADGFARTFAKSVGRSVIDTRKHLSGLQDLFKPLGFANRDAAELSKQVLKLGVDLASFNNIADDEAIQRLTAGLLGESEPLKKFGIVMNEAAVKAELLAMGIKKVDEASNVQKALARMNIIMRSTTDAQGDAIRTAGGFANTLKGLLGSLKDLTAGIGQIFLPSAQLIVKTLREAIQFVAQNENTFAAWGERLAEVTDNLLRFGREVVGNIIGPLGEMKSVGEQAKGTIDNLLESLALLSADPKTGFGIAVDFLRAGFVDVAATFTATLLKGLGSVLSFVGEALPKLGARFGENVRRALFGFDADATRENIERARGKAREYSEAARQRRDGTFQAKNIHGGNTANFLAPSAKRFDEMAAAMTVEANQLQQQLDAFEGRDLKGYFSKVVEKMQGDGGGLAGIVGEMNKASAELRASAEKQLAGARERQQLERDLDGLFADGPAAEAALMPPIPAAIPRSAIRLPNLAELAEAMPSGEKKQFEFQKFAFDAFADQIQQNLGKDEKQNAKQVAENTKKAAKAAEDAVNWWKTQAANAIGAAVKQTAAFSG